MQGVAPPAPLFEKASSYAGFSGAHTLNRAVRVQLEFLRAGLAPEQHVDKAMAETLYELKSPVKDPRTGEIRWWRLCGRVVKKENGQVAVYIDALPIKFDGFLAAMAPNPDYQRQVGEDA